MIRLTVNNNLVNLPADTSISIEKTSPVTNENVGSFSYPFPVSTTKNKKALGYPGRLERASDIDLKNFILDENGIQILRGEIDFDQITASETGLILQSGNTEFSKQMKGKKLTDLNFGRESWFTEFTVAAIQAKLDIWNNKNANPSVSEYVCCQFAVKNTEGTQVLVNESDLSGSTARLTISFGASEDFQKYYCLQFSIGWVLQKIYEAANYRVILNEIPNSVFNDVCVFSKIIRIFSEGYFVGNIELDLEGHLNIEPGGTVYLTRGPADEYLFYKDIMPDFDVLKFIDAVKSLLCISIEIDERLRTVSIFFNKKIFESSNLIELKNSEVTGWQHSEHDQYDGFVLAYQDQDDDLATKSDFKVFGFANTEANKPAAGADYEDKVIQVNSTGRFYKCISIDNVYSWKEIGRLKQYKQGNGENEFSIDVKIPPQRTVGDIDIPAIEFAVDTENIFIDMNQLAFSWFRGIHLINAKNYPLMSFDRYSLNGSIDFTTSLKPAYLYEAVYKEFINWKTYRARECTKYLQLTLAEVVQLQWRKRYVISGIAILLNQVNFEVPYRGIVKINGFTT